jgi:hypothetical protein
MAEPARAGADGGESPGRKPDPRASGWGAQQQAIGLAAESNALAVREALDRPDDDAALEMARLSIRILEKLGDTLRDLSFDEVAFAAERAAGFREGYEACKAQRCRLGVIDGGRSAPGPR